MASGDSEEGAAVREERELGSSDCAICLERCRRPKLLPCFHTFCQACLQGVAGAAPSFPCPACRTPVLLPPGGVGALQRNFYIEEDPGKQTAKMCEVCSEQREATYKCLQCKQKYCGPCRRIHDACTFGRSHSVLWLQPEPGQTDTAVSTSTASAHARDELCAKHPKHEVILYCKVCTTKICMQCKLTSHEGHPTEDLEDAGAKAKAKLQDLVERMREERMVLDAVLATADSEWRLLQDMKQKAEEEIRERVRTLHQWSSQAADNALQSLKAKVQAHVTTLHEQRQRLQHKYAALLAQCDYVTRVLDTDVDADIVSLEAQLTEVSVDRKDVAQVQAGLEKEAWGFTFSHDPGAVNMADIAAFIGVLDKSARGSPGDLVAVSRPPACSTSWAALAGRLVSKAVSGFSNILMPSPRVIAQPTFSRSRVLLAMCATSRSRVWVLTSQGPSARVLELYDEQGKRQERRDKAKMRNPLMTILGNVTISEHSSLHNTLVWVQPGGAGGETSVKEERDFRPCCKSEHGGKYLVATTHKGGSPEHSVVTFHTLQPFKWRVESSFYKTLPGRVCDASESRQYVAVITGSMLAVHASTRQGCTCQSVYAPGIDACPSDACFCVVDGREMLLVAVEADHKVHVLDHTDACRFVRYLDTGSLTLDKPCCLATDYSHRLWVGCRGGLVVLVYL